MLQYSTVLPSTLELLKLDSIRLLSIDDIIPMKLSAIANRGVKKDFYDLYFLLEQRSLEEMLNLFQTKFSDINQFHIIKSLTYFEDAESNPNPHTLKDLTWQEVKNKIIQTVNEHTNKT